MILLHLFYSAVPRVLDTPRIRILVRAAFVVVLAIVATGGVMRGDEPATATAEASDHAGRGSITIVHVAGTNGSSEVSDDPAADRASVPPQQPLIAPAQPEAEVTTGPSLPETAAQTEMPAADEASQDVSSESREAVSVATDPIVASHGDAFPERSRGVPMRPDVVEDFAESGRRFWRAGQLEPAEKAFTRALTANVPLEQKRDLVLEMAGLYREAGQLPKAAAVLEKFIKTYPGDRDIPQVLLRLGVVYRELGVYSMATSRFFQVLNSTLRVSDQDLPEYRRMAMKARLEIAETYAMQGNFTEAEKYFGRLQLLELEPTDRERVLLRGAQMQLRLKQWLPAERALATFLAMSPDSPHLAEVRYMRAKALEELGRKQEAIDEVVALLQMAPPGEDEAARSAAYWKRRCANELANRFYEQGDFLGALSVYQALARASMDPTWRWPAIYQIGLCFERMDMPQRAAEAYDAILSPETAPAAGVKLPDSVAALQEMARWRRSHLVWIEDKAQQLDTLASGDPRS